MLIELLLTRTGVAGYNADELSALENLGAIASFGAHLLIGSREVFANLASNTNLSSRSRVAYSTLCKNYAQIHGSVQKIKSRVVISDQIYAIAVHGDIWRVPLFEFRYQDVTSVAEVLAENINDARFYIGLAKVFAARHFANALPIHLRPRGGGGSTIEGELAACAGISGKFLLCVTDSDRAWSGDQVGTVTSACMAAIGQSTWCVRLLDNRVRTIENLLPNEWLKKTDFGNRNAHLVGAVERLQSSCSDELAQYANLKSCLRLCVYRNHTSVQVRQAFAADIIALEPISPCQPNLCLNRCMELGGIHGAVAGVADYISNNAVNAARSMAIGGIQEQLGSIIFEFGIGWKPVRS